MTEPSDPTPAEAEVLAAARAYEAALASGDTEAASAWFDDDACTSRFGPDGSQLDRDQVLALRASSAPTPDATWLHERARQLGDDVVLHIALLDRGGSTVQRTQAWVRRPAGWRIVHAHVSTPRP